MSDVATRPGEGEEPLRGDSASDPLVDITSQILDEIQRALDLLDYAVEYGYAKKPGGREALLTDEIVTTIKMIAAKATKPTERRDDGDGRRLTAREPIKSSEWVNFELAYHKLAKSMYPVTAETLRDTRDAGRTFWGWHCPAQRFTAWLAAGTIGYAVLIVLGEWALQRFDPVQEGEVDWQNTAMQLVQILIPYAYGGLGACAYLLRSAHYFVYERTFDIRRAPEYFNRVLLGTVSGGAIILFVNYLTDSESTDIKLSSAALGFIGGYSTDFLFSTVENLVKALLPKVDLRPTSREGSAPKEPTTSLEVKSGGMTLKELVEKYEKAEGKDKELYQSLIQKLRDRL